MVTSAPCKVILAGSRALGSVICCLNLGPPPDFLTLWRRMLHLQCYALGTAKTTWGVALMPSELQLGPDLHLIYDAPAVTFHLFGSSQCLVNLMTHWKHWEALKTSNAWALVLESLVQLIWACSVKYRYLNVQLRLRTAGLK